MQTVGTYEPFAGPITLDNLDDLLAHHAARFSGFTMEKDEDDDDDEVVDDDTITDPGDTGDDEEDEDDEEDPDEGKTPEQIKAELKKTREALAKANGEAKKRRLQARAAKKTATKKTSSKDDDEEEEDAEEKAAAKWKPKVIKAAARSALAEAGVEKPERLLRLLDMDDLDVDDEGDVEGLDDEVERLQEEYPELFEKPTKKTKSKIETGDRRTRKSSPKSATERQAAALLGG